MGGQLLIGPLEAIVPEPSFADVAVETAIERDGDGDRRTMLASAIARVAGRMCDRSSNAR